LQPLPKDETEISAGQFWYMTCLGLTEGALSPGRATYTGGLIGGIAASADTVELLVWKVLLCMLTSVAGTVVSLCSE
jgi:hypothetical protein